MERDRLRDLLAWHGRASRNPLVIRGARQVGKTWIVRELARRLGKDLVEVNFERRPEAGQVFESRSPDAVLQSIERLEGRSIRRSESILLLDEIQGAPHALAGLRWFDEECPELAVVATGSLLDFTLAEHGFSMPVGRISYMFLEPMSFREFLCAIGEDLLSGWLGEIGIDTAIEPPVHEKLMGLVRLYATIGGMPAAVREWVDTGSPLAVAGVQQDLIGTMSDDFAKYAARQPPGRLRKVMLSVPRLLGKKFKYSHVDEDEQSRALRTSLSLLCMARICHRVYHSAGHGAPLASEENPKLFKVIFLDSGLASAVLGLVPGSVGDMQGTTRPDRGAMAEQLVGQLLRGSVPGFVDPVLHYYVREMHGSEAEIDYLLQEGAAVVPVEVKAGATGRLRSLHQFMAERKFRLAFRVNSDPPSRAEVDVAARQGDRAKYELRSVPLYLAGEIRRLASSLVEIGSRPPARSRRRKPAA